MHEPIHPSGLTDVLQRVNGARRRGEGSERGAATEETVEHVFAVSRHLAIYGSLAPGESNFGQLSGIEGVWIDGHVHGELFDRGWGARIGFPAMRWDPASPKEVAVKLFVADDLKRQWPRLDAFEGDGYQRILASVHDADDRLIAVANLYELK